MWHSISDLCGGAACPAAPGPPEEHHIIVYWNIAKYIRDSGYWATHFQRPSMWVTAMFPQLGPTCGMHFSLQAIIGFVYEIGILFNYTNMQISTHVIMWKLFCVISVKINKHFYIWSANNSGLLAHRLQAYSEVTRNLMWYFTDIMNVYLWLIF